MAYCPQCLTEYADGSPECIDCGAPLQPGPPPQSAQLPEDLQEPEVRLVKVRSFGGPAGNVSAEVAKNILEASGLRSIVRGEFSGETLPGVDAVDLLVRAEDAAQAAELLESFLDNPTGVAPDEEG
jgi:Putative prokaryotic signal transducing protein